jgi:hypothetical protein
MLGDTRRGEPKLAAIPMPWTTVVLVVASVPSEPPVTKAVASSCRYGVSRLGTARQRRFRLIVRLSVGDRADDGRSRVEKVAVTGHEYAGVPVAMRAVEVASTSSASCGRRQGQEARRRGISR